MEIIKIRSRVLNALKTGNVFIGGSSGFGKNYLASQLKIPFLSLDNVAHVSTKQGHWTVKNSEAARMQNKRFRVLAGNSTIWQDVTPLPVVSLIIIPEPDYVTFKRIQALKAHDHLKRDEGKLLKGHLLTYPLYWIKTSLISRKDFNDLIEESVKIAVKLWPNADILRIAMPASDKIERGWHDKI
jgi:hypothetical protein